MRKRAGILSAIGRGGGAWRWSRHPAPQSRLRRLQMGKRAPADRRPELHLPQPRGPVLHPGRRPPADRPHPVHRQAQPAACRVGESRRQRQRRPGRPAGRAQRQSPGDPAVRPKPTFEANARSAAPPAEVGTSEVTAALLGLRSARCRSPVYNLVPQQGEPALFGFESACSGSRSTRRLPRRRRRLGQRLPRGLHDQRRPDDAAAGQEPARLRRHQRRHLPDHGQPVQRALDHDPQGRLLENPGQFQTYRPSRPGPAGSSTATAASRSRSRRRSPAAPNRRPTDSPSGRHRRPQSPAGAAAAELLDLRTATSRCRAGSGSTPPRAPDLHSCSDAQFGKGTKKPVACPANSKIGTASIQTPLLPAGSLTGNVFLGQQLSRDPDSGNEYRDLRRRRVGPLRDLGAADRQRQRQPPDRPADRGLRRQPAGRRSAPSSSDRRRRQRRR